MSGKLQVFYDGACPVCSREIGFYRARTCGEAVEWVDVSGTGVSLGPDLTRDAALARLHVREPDGTLRHGAAAFGAIWRRVPGFAWAGRLVGWAPAGFVAELGYGLFLKVRPLWRRV